MLMLLPEQTGRNARWEDLLRSFSFLCNWYHSTGIVIEADNGVLLLHLHRPHHHLLLLDDCWQPLYGFRPHWSSWACQSHWIFQEKLMCKTLSYFFLPLVLFCYFVRELHIFFLPCFCVGTCQRISYLLLPLSSVGTLPCVQVLASWPPPPPLPRFHEWLPTEGLWSMLFSLWSHLQKLERQLRVMNFKL